MTRNDAELLAIPPDVTVTSANPGKREPGTGAIIRVSLHDVGVVEVPPIVTMLPLAELPNPVPLMVKEDPTGLTGPTVGEMLLICGDAQARLRLRKQRRIIALIVKRSFDDTVVSTFYIKLSSLPIAWVKKILQWMEYIQQSSSSKL
jgi:hypothetical protein